MNFRKAHEVTFQNILGISFIPYQLALGVSVRWLSCLGGPMFRLYIGPIKVWGSITREVEK